MCRRAGRGCTRWRSPPLSGCRCRQPLRAPTDLSIHDLDLVEGHRLGSVVLQLHLVLLLVEHQLRRVRQLAFALAGLWQMDLDERERVVDRARLIRLLAE